MKGISRTVRSACEDGTYAFYIALVQASTAKPHTRDCSSCTQSAENHKGRGEEQEGYPRDLMDCFLLEVDKIYPVCIISILPRFADDCNLRNGITNGNLLNELLLTCGGDIVHQ